FAKDGAPLPEDWARLPLLRREEVQAAGDALVSGQVPPSHGGLSEIFTSGSTGKPVRAVRTELWSLFWSAFTVRDHLWHRRDLTGTLAAIRESGKGKAQYPDGSRAPSWGRSGGGAFATGPTVSLNITCSIEQQVEWLQRRNPDYLLTHPSIADRLAAHCLEHGIALPRLRQVETISEILRPATRALCRNAWGVPVVDLYTTREAGYIALQCPDHEHYHVQAEGIVVEVLDEGGHLCAPGEVGRVVVTPLHNFAMPLVRYDVGDYAEVGEPCPCGRGLPVLRRILGRRQNMLIMPSGEERWPLLSSSNIQALLAIAPIRQYQFAQTARDVVELRLAVARPLTTAEEDALRGWVRDKFGHPFEVPIRYHAEIPRTAAGKYQDFVTELAD
ncbi:MAG: AMP-binding protein, partial [Alphaproteobacteria bacterium]